MPVYATWLFDGKPINAMLIEATDGYDARKKRALMSGKTVIDIMSRLNDASTQFMMRHRARFPNGLEYIKHTHKPSRDYPIALHYVSVNNVHGTPRYHASVCYCETVNDAERLCHYWNYKACFTAGEWEYHFCNLTVCHT